MSEHTNSSLSSYFSPKTLTQFGVTGISLVASVSYMNTSFKKGGINPLLRKIPIIKNLTPVKECMIEMDLDLSCVVLDDKKNIIDVIWYGQLSNHDDSIYHGGDGLMGAMDFEQRLHHQEQIHVRLSQLSKNAHELLFFVSSYHFHDLCLANKGVLKLSDNENNTIHKYHLSDIQKGIHAVLAWRILRQSDDFLIKAPFAPVIIKDNNPKVFIQTLKSFAAQS
ncbi:MAG: TerD family protein [Moraxella sp.]|nr:TerD family protein [Moraxella sp.]